MREYTVPRATPTLAANSDTAACGVRRRASSSRRSVASSGLVTTSSVVHRQSAIKDILSTIGECAGQYDHQCCGWFDRPLNWVLRIRPSSSPPGVPPMSHLKKVDHITYAV